MNIPNNDERLDIEEFSPSDDLDYSYESNEQRARGIERSLEIQRHQIEDMSSDPTVPKVGRGPPVHVGFDTEYTQDPDDPKSNRFVSYQFHVVGEGGEFTYIHYPKGFSKQSRPKFSKLVMALLKESMKRRVVLEFPSRVVICGFFLRTDLAGFVDLPEFKHEISSAGGSLATRRDVQFDVEVDPKLIRKKLGNVQFVVPERGILRRLSVRFVDMNRHVPVGTSLAKIGEMLGLPKLTIPDGYSIERMDLLLKGDKPAFERYAGRDAEITVKDFLEKQAFAHEQIGLRELPSTASGMAAQMARKTMKDAGLDFNQIFGVERISTPVWNSKSQRPITVKEDVPSIDRAMFEHFAAMSYHGGRSECYRIGPTDTGVFYDFDLAGAYTTAAVDLCVIDYERADTSKVLEDFCGHVLGFAQVTFKHAPGTRFPAAPVRWGDHGLIFPMSGTAFLGAPEIENLLNMGCELEILRGVIYPWRDGNTRPFQPFVERVRELRAKTKQEGNLLAEQYMKLLGNSVYGKLAEGLMPKRVFDTRGMQSVALRPTSITNGIMAAHVTSLVRAVIGELLARIPSNRTVVSVSTDGFLTDTPLEEIDLSGPLAQRFQALCERVDPGKSMLACKHKVEQLLAMRSRGQVTVTGIEGSELVLAKAGVSMSGSRELQNAAMLSLYLNREPGEKIEYKSFVSLRDQWLGDRDVVKETHSTRLNLETDMKRQPVSPVMREVGDQQQHIALDTVPWETVEDAQRARLIFDVWRRDHCLKTLDDWNSWTVTRQAGEARSRRRAVAGNNAGIKMTREGAVGMVRRMFLRAYAQEEWGAVRSMSYPEVARLLTETGYPTTAVELGNARRQKLDEHAVPRSEEVDALVVVIRRLFPGVEIERALISQLDG